ncbi:MAG: alpha/beta hydrolase [Candidatus Microsaccharimonas sp.]|jgi:acetyl esterase
MKKTKKSQRVPFFKRKPFLWTVGIILGIILVVVVAFRVSPFPGAFVIRAVFDQDAQKKLVALEAHKPSTLITVLKDQQYSEGDNDAKLDVYIPQAKVADGAKLPIIIWTHGGAWISGDKANAGPYFELLAEKGFVVVSVNYTLAPNKTYPTQIHQLNAAHAYIKAHAESFYGDPNKIILAGDSAGAQLSSQMATIITNPSYATEVGVVPSLAKSDLAAVVLFCGIYKMEGLTHPEENLSKLISWGDDVTVWSYTGSRDKNAPSIRQMSAYYHVDSNFPKTFISGGNNDPLTDVQSKPMADKLTSLGVEVTSLFYPADHQPALPHEYQFNLDNDDGMNALMQVQDFVAGL